LDALAIKAKELATYEGHPFSRAFAVADVMAGIRAELDKPGVMNAVLSLQGSAIGFRTDKDSTGGYNQAQIKDALIESVMRGLYPVGNEFNIISARSYTTKEGFGRLLKELPGLTNVNIQCSIPHMVGQGATVKVSIKANFKGNPIDENLEFAIRVNAGMGADAITGKSTRKARAWLYGYLTGSEIPEGDAEDSILSNAKNVTPVSMFEKMPATEPVTVAAEESAQGSVDWSRSTPDDIYSEISRLQMIESLTATQCDAWSQKRHGKEFMELPVAMLRSICKDPESWIKQVKAVAQ
jgi:hypothetical protein